MRSIVFLFAWLTANATIPNTAAFLHLFSENRNVAPLDIPFLKSLEGTKQQRQPKDLVMPLLKAASKKQSIWNRLEVEDCIEELSLVASRNPSQLRKTTIVPGSYRTVWSTVTGDNFVGVGLGHRPSNVLGGPSWQVVFPDNGDAENIVYWKSLDLRMAGLAQLEPLPGVGYDLFIRGLEFRWGAEGCPEQQSSTSKFSNPKKKGKAWTLFQLKRDQTLGNGVGTLEVLYNDGMVRITKDNIQQNTYVHIQEPLSPELEEMFAA